MDEMLSPEVLAIIKRSDFGELTRQQLSALQDIATNSSALLESLGRSQTIEAVSADQANKLLDSIRESLSILKDKEAPALPDYATPVVKAVEKLDASFEKALKKVDFKPEFKPNIKVEAPKVDVPKPDMSGVEKVLKKDLPQALDKAIKGLKFPEQAKTDFSPVVEKLEEMSEKLTDIDTGTRLKVQFPSTLKVTNPDGSTVGGGSASVEYITEFYSDATYTYICKALPGTALSAASWQVKRMDASGNKRYADGNDDFDNQATDLATVQAKAYS